MIKKLFYSHLGQETLIIAAGIVAIGTVAIGCAWILLSTL